MKTMYIYHPLPPDVLIPILDLVVKCTEKAGEIKYWFDSKKKADKK